MESGEIGELPRGGMGVQEKLQVTEAQAALGSKV